MNKFKTPKGTELPVMNIKGKDYLQVQWRLVWFREEHPDWTIETHPKVTGQDACLFMATIRDTTGRTISTAHKFEDKNGFPDFIEKAETGAIGRALALIGYGTQFCAEELDEGSRLADAPVGKPNPHAAGLEQPPVTDGSGFEDGVYRIDFGQWNKRTLNDVLQTFGRDKMVRYIEFLESSAAKKNEVLGPKQKEFIAQSDKFLGDLENVNDRNL